MARKLIISQKIKSLDVIHTQIVYLPLDFSFMLGYTAPQRLESSPNLHGTQKRHSKRMSALRRIGVGGELECGAKTRALLSASHAVASVDYDGSENIQKFGLEKSGKVLFVIKLNWMCGY